MKEMPNPPTVPCSCWHEDVGCVCGDSERVLRHVMRSGSPLAADQREWCLQEIDRIEGHSRTDHETSTDAAIAASVLDAWTDYARDKGLM